MSRLRHARLARRVIHWMPFDWDTRGCFYWLGPIEYARLLWSRATWRHEPWPEKPKNRHLIVPIEREARSGCCCPFVEPKNTDE